MYIKSTRALSVLILNKKRCEVKDMSDELQQYPTEDIIRILSNLPGFLRESMMRSRLQELCTKDSKTQNDLIDLILEGLSSAEQESLKKVIRTWLGVVSRLESSEVSTIFSTFISRYEKGPSICESNYFAVLLEEYQSLEGDRRIILRDSLVEAALNQYRGRQIMLTLPEKVRSALEL
jgi:hypothetical protein